ncbi:MurR/RpiR family transcriptional regulator [Streptomyces sp. NPDC001020]
MTSGPRPSAHDTRTDDSGVTVLIRGLLPSLTPSQRCVGEAVLADPALAGRSTIAELATRAGTSLTSVTRFCRALGLGGYADLRHALAAEAGRDRSLGWSEAFGGEIGPDDGMDRVLTGLVEADGRALVETAARQDVEVVEKAVRAMAAARRTDIYAVSGSGTIAAELRLRLHHIGRIAFVWTDVHDALASAALLGPGDVALGISHSGETDEVTEPLELARRRGATTVAVTNFPRSPLARAADFALVTATRELRFRSGGIAARHAQMLLIDCLYLGVAQHTFAASEQALTAAREAVSGRRGGLTHRQRNHVAPDDTSKVNDAPPKASPHTVPPPS